MPLTEAEELELLQLKKRRTSTTPTKVPPILAEYASGVNRGVMGALDIVPNAINEAMGLMGIDTRIPNVSGLGARIGVGQKGFMEPGLGRDIVQAAGEWTPAYATMRPVPNRAAISQKELLDEAAPSIEALKAKANALYGKVDDIKAYIDPQDVKRFAEDALNALDDADDILAPKAWRMRAKLQAMAETNDPVSIGEIEKLRRQAGAGVMDRTNALEVRLGKLLQSKVDDFVDELPQLKGPDGTSAAETLKAARSFHQQRRKAETIEEAIELAHEYRSGFENGLRLQFAGLSRRIIKGQLKGFTAEEKAAIQKVARGGKLENAFKLLGKFGVGDEGAMRVLMPSLGGAAGAAIGSPLGPAGSAAGALAVPAIGQVFYKAAARLTSNNARIASAMMRAGQDGRAVANAYMKTVPKSQWNSQELAGLMLSNRVPVKMLNEIKAADNVLAANAAFLAGLVLEKEDVDQVTENGNR